MSAGQRIDRLAIGGELTIGNAAAARERLLAALGAGDVVEVDLSDVTELDTAGLQVLLAAEKSAAAAGKGLRLFDPSRAVIDTADYLGVLDRLPFARGEGSRP